MATADHRRVAPAGDAGQSQAGRPHYAGGNLLAVQPRTFRITTDSAHDLEVFLNLARRMKLTGINQLWVADISVPQQAA
jgi:hypothetical protein